MLHRTILIMAGGLLLLISPAQAADAAKDSPEAPAAGDANTFEIAAANDSKDETALPLYQPPQRGSPTRREGGATRGGEIEALYLTVLAPMDTGLTSQASPDLYWYVSRVPSRQVEFTLIKDDAIHPVVELALQTPVSGGIEKISLADIGVRLDAGATYEWSVALIEDPDSRSTDIITSGTLRRVTLDEALQGRIEAADLAGKVAIFAENGLWYDAIEAASSGAADTSAPATWRKQRANLLEQVGLGQVVANDKSL